jgi:hypothetical protein
MPPDGLRRAGAGSYAFAVRPAVSRPDWHEDVLDIEIVLAWRKAHREQFLAGMKGGMRRSRRLRRKPWSHRHEV